METDTVKAGESQEFIIVDCPPKETETRLPYSKMSRAKATLLGVFVVMNITVITFALLELIMTAGRLGKNCQSKNRPVSPLCVLCEDAGEFAGQMRRYSGGRGDVCCPLDHQQTAEVMDKIYQNARDEKQEEFLRQPQPQYSSFVMLPEPEGVGETLWHANRAKPSGHVTGIHKMDAEEFYALDQDDKVADLQVVGDWPLRVEPYRTVSTGYVQRLTWGLSVPASGLYRVHTSVNFYFRYEHADTNQESSDTVPVIHQLSRYHVGSGDKTVLVERNHTIASTHRDGVSSFLVTLARLDAGDIVFVSVSHAVALGMQDRWHSEGLVLVE